MAAVLGLIAGIGCLVAVARSSAGSSRAFAAGAAAPTAALVRGTPGSAARAAAPATPATPAASATGNAGTSAPAGPQAVGDALSVRRTPSPTASSPTGPFEVVGLGDSVPSGSSCHCTTYVDLVGTQAAQRAGRPANVDNLARGGQTTQGVIEQLQQPEVQATVASADLVIITVGANDFDADLVADGSCDPPGLTCYQPVLAAQPGELDILLQAIADLRNGHSSQVLITGYWNVFLDGEVGRAQGAAYVTNSNALTVADNAIIAAAGARHGATYVDIYAPFKGSDGTTDCTALLASDGDHPNAAGHRLIATTLEAALT